MEQLANDSSEGDCAQQGEIKQLIHQKQQQFRVEIRQRDLNSVFTGKRLQLLSFGRQGKENQGGAVSTGEQPQALRKPGGDFDAEEHVLALYAQLEQQFAARQYLQCPQIIGELNRVVMSMIPIDQPRAEHILKRLATKTELCQYLSNFLQQEFWIEENVTNDALSLFANLLSQTTKNYNRKLIEEGLFDYYMRLLTNIALNFEEEQAALNDVTPSHFTSPSSSRCRVGEEFEKSSRG